MDTREELRKYIERQIAEIKKTVQQMGYRDQLYGGDYMNGCEVAYEDVLAKLDELEFLERTR